MKKTNRLFLVMLTLVLSVNLFSIGAAAQTNLSLAQAKSYIAEEDIDFFDGTAILDFNGEEEIGKTLLSFFSSYFKILETGDVSDYKNETDVNFYLFTKHLEYTHDFYEVFYQGIEDTSIGQLLIKEATHAGDEIHAAAYVAVKYIYNGTAENSMGNLFFVTLSNGAVTALDTVSVETQLVKDKINTTFSARSTNIYEADFETTKSAIDGLFAEKKQNLAKEKAVSDARLTGKSTVDEDANTFDAISVQPRASVSYNATSALTLCIWRPRPKLYF